MKMVIIRLLGKSPTIKNKMILNWRDGSKTPLKMLRGAAVVDEDVAYFMSRSGKVCSYNVSSKTTAVTSKEHLIVAGGAIGQSHADNINTVEVMDTKSLVWSTVASLPHPYSNASGTICGVQLYMLGGYSDKGDTKSVLTCSLTKLLQSSPSSSAIWHRVADAPAYYSTCAAVNGELLAVGGCDKGDKPSSTIHKYNPTTNYWDLVSNMPTARWLNLVTVLPTNEMMVVGGCIGIMTHNVLDIVEITDFSHF